MKWCNNCQANKESWAEKLKDYNKYSSNQCWECNKYTLENWIRVEIENKLPVEAETRIGCNMRGGYWKEDVYRNGDGSSTTTYIKRGNWEVQEMRVEALPKRPSSPDCKIL